MHRIYPAPTQLKLSHRYATEVDFQIYEMGPIAYYMANDFFISNPPLVPCYPPHLTEWEKYVFINNMHIFYNITEISFPNKNY